MTMRILHILDHSLPLQSGYAFRSAAILREQRRMNWATAQITGPKQGPGPAEETVDGLTYGRAPHSMAMLAGVPVVNQLDVIAALRRSVARLARHFDPHIIHAHSPCLNAIAGAAVARRRGVPFVYELRASWEDAAVSHGSTTEGSLRYRLSRLLETRVVRAADAVTTICEGLRADVVARGVPPGRVTVIPNAVDMEMFGRPAAGDPALKRRYCEPGTTLIGFLGSYYAYEGLDLLLRAVPGIRRQHPHTHFLLAGGGPEEPRLRELARSLGIEGAVSFAGRVPQQDIPGYYGVLDLLVYPRRRNRLTELVTPLKPLEAMAQGRAVLASDVGGHRELIAHGETGFLFAPDDPQSIVTAVCKSLASGVRLDAVRERARRYVAAERTWSRVVAGYRPVYERLQAAAAGASVAAGAGG
jgi:PEP-CTERM/exosortase A-associated glycosyltransferase